jgi:hypothetical protein
MFTTPLAEVLLCTQPFLGKVTVDHLISDSEADLGCQECVGCRSCKLTVIVWSKGYKQIMRSRATSHKQWWSWVYRCTNQFPTRCYVSVGNDLERYFVRNGIFGNRIV